MPPKNTYANVADSQGAAIKGFFTIKSSFFSGDKISCDSVGLLRWMMSDENYDALLTFDVNTIFNNNQKCIETFNKVFQYTTQIKGVIENIALYREQCGSYDVNAIHKELLSLPKDMQPVLVEAIQQFVKKTPEAGKAFLSVIDFWIKSDKKLVQAVLDSYLSSLQENGKTNFVRDFVGTLITTSLTSQNFTVITTVLGQLDKNDDATSFRNLLKKDLYRQLGGDTSKLTVSTKEIEAAFKQKISLSSVSPTKVAAVVENIQLQKAVQLLKQTFPTDTAGRNKKRRNIMPTQSSVTSEWHFALLFTCVGQSSGSGTF